MTTVFTGLLQRETPAMDGVPGVSQVRHQIVPVLALLLTFTNA